MVAVTANLRLVLDLTALGSDDVQRLALQLLRAVTTPETDGRCPWCGAGDLSLPYGAEELAHPLPVCPEFSLLVEGGPAGERVP
jgi:hypothetical protein